MTSCALCNNNTVKTSYTTFWAGSRPIQLIWPIPNNITWCWLILHLKHTTTLELISKLKKVARLVVSCGRKLSLLIAGSLESF